MLHLRDADCDASSIGWRARRLLVYIGRGVRLDNIMLQGGAGD